MDFVLRSPKNRKGNDIIWVIVDRLTKSILFLPIRRIDSDDKLTKLFVDEVVRLYGVLVAIVFNRDPRFTF